MQSEEHFAQIDIYTCKIGFSLERKPSLTISKVRQDESGSESAKTLLLIYKTCWTAKIKFKLDKADMKQKR